MEKCNGNNTNTTLLQQQPRLSITDISTDATTTPMMCSTPDNPSCSKSKGAIAKGSKSTASWASPSLVTSESPSATTTTTTTTKTTSAWLNMSIDAALGCRANIFQIHRPMQTGKRSTALAQPSSTAVTVHPQASPLVCKWVVIVAAYERPFS